MVRVRGNKQPKKKKGGAHPARGPKRDRKIFRQCMRSDPHTNHRHSLRTRSPCYEEPPWPTSPRHEGGCAVKVSMRFHKTNQPGLNTVEWLGARTRYKFGVLMPFLRVNTTPHFSITTPFHSSHLRRPVAV